MPPKKLKKKGSTQTVVDGVSTKDMSKEELEAHIKRLREEIDREREDRNYYQLERDKINTFWEISKHQLVDKQSELRAKQHEAEEAEERHHLELKIYKQKVKHMLFEHQNALAAQKTEGVVIRKLAENQFFEDKNLLVQDKRFLKVNLKETQLAKEDLDRKMRLDHEERMHQLRQDFECQSEEDRRVNNMKITQLHDAMELQRKTEVHEIEERKNDQIIVLKENHERAFTEIKNYYTDITLNNLTLINTLKDQIENFRVKEGRLEKHNTELVMKNKSLEESLLQSTQECANLNRAMENHLRDVRSLNNTKEELKKTKRILRDLKLNHEVMTQRFKFVEGERDELYEKFVGAVQEVQQKCGLKNAILEHRLTSLGEKLEVKEAQLNEVMATGEVDPIAVTETKQRIEETLDSKNLAIKELQYELARVCKAHRDLLAVFRSKLDSYGIRFEDLGFQPQESLLLSHQNIGRGPAGLV